MKTKWLCKNCYKQECLSFDAKEIEQYTDVNSFDELCYNCKNKIGTHHIDKYKVCLNCKFWRFIRTEDYEDRKGPHGECRKINYFSTDEVAWVDQTVTYADFDGKLQEQNIEYSTRMKKDLAGNELFLESSLITKPNFGCNLFEDKD